MPLKNRAEDAPSGEFGASPSRPLSEARLHPPSSYRTQAGELPALTVLRLVLALYALLYHVEIAWNPGTRVGSLPVLGPLLEAGYVSVNGFFVLSGFVLIYGFLDGPRLGPRGFFRGRLARIYPMHALGILVSLPLTYVANRAAHVGPTPLERELVYQALTVGLLIQAWVPSRALDLNGPSWSLSVEAFFYGLFPFLAPRLARLSQGRLAVVGVLALGVLLLPPLVHPLTHGIAGASPTDRVVLFNPLLHLPSFVLGMLAGVVFLRQKPKRGRWRWTAAGLSVVLLTLTARSATVPVGLLHAGLLDPLVALLIYALAAGWPPGRPARDHGLALRAFLLLGRASYALYILHKPIYLWLGRATGRTGRPPTPTYVAGYLVLGLAVSMAAWWLVEEPLRALLGGGRDHRAQPGGRQV